MSIRNVLLFLPFIAVKFYHDWIKNIKSCSLLVMFHEWKVKCKFNVHPQQFFNSVIFLLFFCLLLTEKFYFWIIRMYTINLEITFKTFVMYANVLHVHSFMYYIYVYIYVYIGWNIYALFWNSNIKKSKTKFRQFDWKWNSQTQSLVFWKWQRIKCKLLCHC
jgi:hypothetical protein